jgi:glycosyl transferase family 87
MYTSIGPRVRIAAICAALAVLVAMVLLLVRPSLDPARIRPLPLLILAWVAFLFAAWLLRSVTTKVAVALILAGGVAVQVAAVSAPPQNSNDLYRYIWDGNVQAAGIDAYAYVPASRALEDLRNNFLWYPGAEYCVGPSATLAAGCTRINRPTVPTIYPPVAEAYFLGVHYLPDASDSSTPIQSTTAGIAVLTTVLLLFGLRRLRRTIPGCDVRMAAFWSWCPTVALEAGNSAHVDIVAVAITLVALLVLATARTRFRTAVGGVLFGLAVATKMTPVLAGPALLRRRWITVVVSSVSAFTAVYIPHLIAVGSKVIGFLPGYLQQEGYDSGTRFGIIGLVAGGHAAIVIAVAVLAVTGLLVLRFADPDRPWRGAVVMTAAALAVATPHYQWYALLLVMLVALDGRPEWLAFAAGGYYATEPDMGRLTVPTRYHDAVAYGVPVLVVAAGSAWRAWRASRSRHARPVSVPVSLPVPVPVPGPVPVSVPGPVTPEPSWSFAQLTRSSGVNHAIDRSQDDPSAAVIAAEEHAISAPPLRSILN